MFTPHRAALLLLILTAVLYAPSLGYGWVYEDQNDLETTFSTTRPAGNRWITAATVRASFAVSGADPWAYHAGNVLVHLVNGGVLWAMLPATWPAVFALGLFWLHPLQVESVAYISNRADLVMTTFLLLALLAAQRRQWWAVVPMALGAMLAKESGVMVLPLIALWAVWRGVSWPTWTRWGVAVGLACGVALVSRWGWTIDLGWTARELTKLLWFGTRAVGPMGLSVDQDWAWISPAIAVGGLVIGVCLLIWSVTHPHSAFDFVVLFVVLSVLPRLVVPLYEGLHAHHLYASMVGASVGIGYMTPKVCT